MSLSKREFLQVLSAASVAGMGLARYAEADAATAEAGLYDLPPLSGSGTGAGIGLRATGSGFGGRMSGCCRISGAGGSRLTLSTASGAGKAMNLKCSSSQATRMWTATTMPSAAGEGPGRASS